MGEWLQCTLRKFICSANELSFIFVFLFHSFLIEQDDQWIKQKTVLVDHFKKIWNSEAYLSQISKVQILLEEVVHASLCVTVEVNQCHMVYMYIHVYYMLTQQIEPFNLLSEPVSWAVCIILIKFQ